MIDKGTFFINLFAIGYRPAGFLFLIITCTLSLAHYRLYIVAISIKHRIVVHIEKAFHDEMFICFGQRGRFCLLQFLWLNKLNSVHSEVLNLHASVELVAHGR